MLHSGTLTMEISILFLCVLSELAVDPRRLHEGSAAVIIAGGGLVSGGIVGLVNNLPCYYAVRSCPAPPPGTATCGSSSWTHTAFADGGLRAGLLTSRTT